MYDVFCGCDVKGIAECDSTYRGYDPYLAPLIIALNMLFLKISIAIIHLVTYALTWLFYSCATKVL